MENNSDFIPNWASNPGEIINDNLRKRKVSVPEFANLIGMTIAEARGLLRGFTPIDENIATTLNKTLGGSINFWIGLQKLYDEYIQTARTAEEARWLKELPIKEMHKNGWIKGGESNLISSLTFFNVPDVWTWRKKYSDISALALFRKSSTFETSAASIATWIRQGEIQAEKLPLGKWNADLFKSKINEIKQLTRQKDPLSFLGRLRSLCAECGVALAVVPTPKGCSASGAAKFLDSGHGLIIVSFRYKTDDHFWFTFYHEAGHLLMHGDRDTFIDEDVKDPLGETEEQQANDFALEALFPGKLKDQLKNLKVSDSSLKTIAKEAGVSLGIIVGQLQYFGKIQPNHYNGFKRKFDTDKIFQNIG